VSFYEIDTDGVYSSGQRTAAHAPGAETLARQYLGSLESAHGVVHHPTVVAAVARYRDNWQPRVNEVAPQIDALGTNTSSSATIITRSDQTSTTLLSQQGSAAETQTNVLSRPINAV
jgi:hypothetical protein